MTNEIKQVYSEVYDIILGISIDNRIPKSFLDMLEKNRDKTYKVKIDYEKSFMEQKLLEGTKVILGLIYRDFLCDEKERAELIAQDKKAFIEYQEELRKKYNPNNLFKK